MRISVYLFFNSYSFLSQSLRSHFLSLFYMNLESIADMPWKERLKIIGLTASVGGISVVGGIISGLMEARGYQGKISLLSYYAPIALTTAEIAFAGFTIGHEKGHPFLGSIAGAGVGLPYSYAFANLGYCIGYNLARRWT